MEDLDSILDHSLIAVARAEEEWRSEQKPYGVPLIVDFNGIAQAGLERWARRLLHQREVATAA